MATISSAEDMLYLHSGFPSLNTVSVLIFGVESINKKKLAETIISLSSSFTVNIRIANNLPLEKDENSSPSKIDYICFIVDISQKESLKKVTDSLKFIDVKFFLSRSCLIVHIPNGCRENFSIELESVNHLVKNYNLMTIFGNLETGVDKISLQLLKLIEIASGFKKFCLLYSKPVSWALSMKKAVLMQFTPLGRIDI